MAHWKNLSNYNFLGSYSLEGKCKELNVTIKKIEREKVTGTGGKVDYCVVGYFDEKEVNGVEIKPMILNKTNCKAIEKALGTGDTDEWIGQPITIYETTTKFQRDLVPCLRVKDKKPEVEAKKAFFCEVCGVEIPEATYRASVAKYGVGLCSAACKDKYETNNKDQEEKVLENNENII